MKSSASKLSRRNFLLGAGAGGVLTTAAVVITKNAPSQAKKAEAVTGSKGYHLTDHIRKYYSTTKI